MKQSLLVFEQYTKTQNGILFPAPGYGIPIYAHWMALSLLAGEDFELMLQIHFQKKDIKPLIQKKLGHQGQFISQDLTHSFVNELLNLLAVRVKNHLSERSITCDVSIPIVCRGFDNYFFDKPMGASLISGIWRLQCDAFPSQLLFSFDAQILSEPILLSLSQEHEIQEPSDPQEEFL
jgi:hypothetical protein